MACARVASTTGSVHLQRGFGTTTRELLALADWLAAQGCTHVVMEATGVYWKSHEPAAHHAE
jgi:3-deoxy-D-arabino-heptulosonate 7-phosphate (DAHP) synthase